MKNITQKRKRKNLGTKLKLEAYITNQRKNYNYRMNEEKVFQTIFSLLQTSPNYLLLFHNKLLNITLFINN